MPRITISYRRDDSGVITGRIFDRLVERYSRDAVFRDIDNYGIGDFRQLIGQALDESDIILAIVGPRWMGSRGGVSRLANAADPVRLEIEAALQKGKLLIPVLVLRARMPRPDQLPESLQDFAYRNALEVDDGRDFDYHVSRLIKALDGILGTENPADAIELPSDPIEQQAVAEPEAARDTEATADLVARLQVEQNSLRAHVAELESARQEGEQRITSLQAENNKLRQELERLGRMNPTVASTAELSAPVRRSASSPPVRSRRRFGRWAAAPGAAIVLIAASLITFLLVHNNILLAVTPAAVPTHSAEEAYRLGVEAAYQHEYTQAMSLFREAADQGDADAQYNVGWLYENGLGIPKDIGEARRWYRLSANQGFEGAKKALARIGG